MKKPEHHATTVLSFMTCCLFGGKKVLYKALPVFRLDADFQYEKTMLIINSIKKCDGTIVAILCDNNRVNQSFFKKFDCITPWCIKDNTFLLFDYVHILKSIRNNWLTERTQELRFFDNDESKVAKWSDLKKLNSLETHTVSLSKLNDQAVAL